MDFGLGVLLEARDLFSGTFQRAGMAFREFEGATSTAGQAITSNLKLLGIGMTILSTGIAGLALLAPTVHAASEFGQKIAEISTLTEEASLNVGFLSDEVLNLNTQYGGGTAKQAKALYDGISAGASNAAEAHSLLAASNRLAVAGVTEVGVALDGLTSSMNAYGRAFSKENLGAFSDVFMVAVRQGKTTVPELSHVIGEVAPTASALKVTFDELGAAIATVTAKGIKTNQAATGLKAVFANILKPTSDAAAEAARLGIKFDQTALRALGLKGFLDSITGSAKYNEKSMSKLFGSVEGLNTVLALTAGGSAKFAENIAAMAEKTGKADAAFKRMEATLAFQGKRFEAAKENAMILMGQALEPAAAAAAKLGAALLGAFNDLPEGVRFALVRGLAFASTLLVVVGAALALKAAIGIVSAGMAAAGVTFSGILLSLAPIAAALGAVVLGFYAFREAYDRNLGGLGDFVDKFVGRVVLLGKALAQAFTDGGFSGAVRDELNKAENEGVKNFAIRIFVTVGRLQEFFSRLADGFFDAINENWPVFQKFMEAIDELSTAFGGLFEAANPGKSSETFDSYGNAGKTAGGGLAKLAIVVVELATTFVKLITAMEPIVEKIGKVVDAFGGMKGIVTALEYALVILAARSIASAVLSLYELGAAGIAGGAGVAKTVAQVIAMNGMSIGGVASSIASGISSIGTAAAAALGPVGAITIALVGLYAAWHAYEDLDKKSAGHGMQLWLVNAKHNLGITNDAEYMKERTALTGERDSDPYYAALARKEAKLKALGSVVDSGDGSSADMPAAAMVPPPGVSAESLYATVAAATANASSPELPPMNVSVKVALDGDELSSHMESASRSRADRSFTPGIPVAD